MNLSEIPVVLVANAAAVVALPGVATLPHLKAARRVTYNRYLALSTTAVDFDGKAAALQATVAELEVLEGELVRRGVRIDT